MADFAAEVNVANVAVVAARTALVGVIHVAQPAFNQVGVAALVT